MSRRQRHLGYRIAVAGLLLIAAMTLMPHPEETSRVSDTPVTCVVCGDLGGVDVLLNILLFVPLGIGLGLAGFSWRRIVALAALVTLGVELLQMKVIAGRDASLGDVLANTLGSGLGALLAARWRQLVFPSVTGARRVALAYGVALGWIWAGTAWALGPAFPQGAPWYGAWAAELENLDRFVGVPLMVTAGGEPLLPGRALDQSRLQDAVTANPSLSFRVVLGARPRRLAPIGSIVDDRHRDVMLIGQERADLAFLVRMRSTIVRLRNPIVYLRNGMDGQAGDTTEAEGALRDGRFELRSVTRGRTTIRHLSLSASWGWSLVTPWDAVLGEEVRLLTALWIAGLATVLAYWSAMAGGAALAIIPVTGFCLLCLVPAAAGLPPAEWSEWMAFVTGVTFGIVAARSARIVRATAEAELSTDGLTTHQEGIA